MRKSPRPCGSRLRRSLEMDIRCRRAPRPGREDSGIEIIRGQNYWKSQVGGFWISKLRTEEISNLRFPIILSPKLPSEAVSLAVDGHNVPGIFRVVFDLLS